VGQRVNCQTPGTTSGVIAEAKCNKSMAELMERQGHNQRHKNYHEQNPLPLSK
jgi:hypothetical protein